MTAPVTAPVTRPATRGSREVLRLVPPVVLWWVWVAFAVLNAADFLVQGLPSARFGAVVSAILLLVTALMYTLALRPKVVLDGAGLTVVNPFRVHRVPWRLIQAVDTGEWVRVHFAASGPAAETTPSSAAGKTVSCWALYVSSRARRKIVRGAPRSRSGLDSGPGYAQESSRLPEEGRYLASLPVAKAMAVRLDSRAARERARQPGPGGADSGPEEASASWSWPALAAAVVPALILLAVAVIA